MQYQLAPLFCRPWTLNGISPRLIESHYETNYGSALRRLNAIAEELETSRSGNTPAEVIEPPQARRGGGAQLDAAARALLREPGRRRQGRAGGDGRRRSRATSVRSTAGARSSCRSPSALAGGSGWVLLTYVPRDRRLINQSASDHSQNIAGGIPILAIDMYEHAYHIDFGSNATAYIAAFMRNIDWNAVRRAL